MGSAFAGRAAIRLPQVDLHQGALTVSVKILQLSPREDTMKQRHDAGRAPRSARAHHRLRTPERVVTHRRLLRRTAQKSRTRRRMRTLAAFALATLIAGCADPAPRYLPLAQSIHAADPLGCAEALVPNSD